MAVRVSAMIVPWGREDMAENIGTLFIYRAEYDARITKIPKALANFYHWYVVELESDPAGLERKKIGTFKMHRYGWYRNRLGLAARGLKMLQDRRDSGKFLPTRSPFGDSDPYTKEKNGS